MATTDDRDPRTDPRPGDILADGPYVYEVRTVTTGEVRYVEHEVREVDIASWRLLRQRCRVVSRGAEGSGA